MVVARGLRLSGDRTVSEVVGKISVEEATRLARYRLDVKRLGSPCFVPESFHSSHEEAFDAGLLAITGQGLALKPPPGVDFVIRDTWTL